MVGILVYKKRRRETVGMIGARTSKTPKQLERHMKGVANHFRIKILMLIAENPKLSVDDIARKVGGHFKTISVHTLKLVQAGLVDKAYEGLTVRHSLSPYGKRIYNFLKLF